ncbi:SDR family NAD(P)-dependent oxidoreductase [Streptosporangium amethystogenes]|uniref:SDR family NAD(P)-dependent oxidoreductase n=1 Tax=Streptosporangium amethystogenes TaxID=2002 RepID=UPI0004C980BA|nr:SDR family NAD(P)-dependent oxidoreductase [Streptosporangium amethystogenes]
MFSLANQVAVITGAASGIGAATAKRFASAGADLILAAYSPDGHDVDAVRTAVTRAGRRVHVVETDVSDTADVEALVGTALSEFGRVDIALANAAIARRRASAALGDEDWNRTLDIDLTGVWRVFRAALGPMTEAGYGRLLATTSTAGAFEAWEEHAHYSAAKAGIVGMVRSLAAEVGPHGITVNAIAPGIIATPQTLDSVNSLGADGIAHTGVSQPVRRVGQPDDIAAAYHYLASPDASFVTGHVLLVDGGRMLMRG